MKILLADDEPLSRQIVGKALAGAGYEVTAVADGSQALRALRAPDAPKLAVLDWSMPEIDGVQVIRMIRAIPSDQPPYLIVLTAHEGLEHILVALENGANDYVAKSQDIRELVSRVRVGARVVELQAELARRVTEAERALTHIKRLQGLLPICSYCKKIETTRTTGRRSSTTSPSTPTPTSATASAPPATGTFWSRSCPHSRSAGNDLCGASAKHVPVVVGVSDRRGAPSPSWPLARSHCPARAIALQKADVRPITVGAGGGGRTRKGARPGGF